MSQQSEGGAAPVEEIALERLPFPTLLLSEGVVSQVNRAFFDLLGWSAGELVGLPVMNLIERIVEPNDRLALANIAKERAALRAAGTAPPTAPQSGRIWVRLLAKDSQRRAVRLDWTAGEAVRESFIFVTEAEPEAFGQRVTERLARAASALSDGRNETEILERATEALAVEGLVATVLLIDGDDPLLRYGPTSVPPGIQRITPHVELPRPPVALLMQINPHFSRRFAAFIVDGSRLVRDAFPEPLSSDILRALAAKRMVQAPLFVGDQAYGAFVVTGDSLTPLVATAIELFAELVGHALANLQLRHERVERERLAALGEAAAVMAHEVRNPVAAIRNALTLMRGKPGGAVVPDELLAIISEETARLDQLVNQLLELGRPLSPHLRMHSLAELAQTAQALLVDRNECAAGRIELRPTGQPVMALVDPDSALLAVTNVLRNAVQSTSERGRVVVTFQHLGQDRGLIVEDDGPGFKAEVLARVGEPFTTTRATGTGMGLAVVRRVMEALSGRVEVDASSLEGARVSLWFSAAL